MKKDIKLVNDKILLRLYRRDEAALVFEAATESIVELGPWMPWAHPGYTLKESKNWIKTCVGSWKRGSAYEFAIFDSETGDYLGGCGLNHIDTAYKTANLGYWVRSSRTRQGIAPAAAKLLVHFGFNALHLNRIEIIASTENIRSQRVAEKAGAKREGILRNRIPLEGRVHDAVVFSFIPQDFLPDQ